MKVRTFIYGLLATTALAGCSSDDLAENKDNSGDVSATARYLSVNIVSTPTTAGVRADQYEENNAKFEDGDSNENSVSSVRFYFFDENGNAAAVKPNGLSYYDWTPTGSGANHSQTVEKQLDAVIVINTKEGDQLPKQMVAVLNPEYANLTNYDAANASTSQNLSLAELRAITNDYEASTSKTNGFVMMNSVYADGATTDAFTNEVVSNQISLDKLMSSEDAAKANPVSIYVERNVAKVRLTLSDAVTERITKVGDEQLIALQKNVDGDLTDYEINKGTGTQKIYLKVTGWNITADTENGYLSKHITPAWNKNLFGTSTTSNIEWNWPAYFRSYWAYNSTDAGQRYHSFTEIGTNSIGAGYPLYANENAADDATTGMQREYPTQVIMAGTLVDESGEPLTICDFGGAKYFASKTATGETDFSEFKKVMLQYATALYHQSGNTRVKVTPDDVEFVTAMSQGYAEEGQENSGRCYVVLKLKNFEEGKWFSSTDETATALSEDEANEILQAVGKAKIWNTGLTYYYFPISHLAASGVGQYGVVRNHIYNCEISRIVGLGTPVYDPDEVVYPEKPKEENTYLAAKINILSWRVVNNSVNLDWE